MLRRENLSLEETTLGELCEEQEAEHAHETVGALYAAREGMSGIGLHSRWGEYR